MRAAMIQRMASEIGLDISRRYDNSDLDSGTADKFRWNDLRTRAFMIINEHRQVKCTLSVSANVRYFDVRI
jgi:hypothetical protein